LLFRPLLYKIHAMADGSRSSFGGKPEGIASPEWVRWVMPSIADLIFIVLLCSLSFTALSTKLLNDAGIGWHIRTGQQILATHAIPRVDPYSSIMGGKPWIAWEWLYDAVVGGLEYALGLNGVVWFTVVVIATVFSWTFHLVMARGTSLFTGLLLLLLALSASMIHVLARPHVLSWLFAVAWYSILDFTERECLEGGTGPRSRWLWFLPGLMIVWVNVHGGFLLGILLVSIFWIAALRPVLTTKEARIEESFQKIAWGKRLRDLTWVGVLSAAATLANPHGWRLHQHIFAYLSNGFFMEHIEEFQSPNFHLLAPKCFLALLILMLAATACGRKLKQSEVLLALFAMYAGLYAARNIPVSSILLVLLVGPLLPRIGLSGFVRRMTALDSRLRGHLWPIAAVILVLLVDLNGGRIGSKLWANAHFDPTRMPVGAVNHMEKNDQLGPVLSPDYWGGYLIYRLHPKTQVVIDDRHDLYGEQVLKSYLKMVHPGPGWDDFLRQYKVSCVVMPKTAQLTVLMNETPGWKSVYSDDLAVIFVRADSKQDRTNSSPEHNSVDLPANPRDDYDR